MGPLIVIVFWLFLAAIYAGIFIALSSLVFIGRKKGKKWLMLLAGFPAGGMALVAIIATIFITFGIISGQKPENVFKSTFGTEATAEIRDLKSDLYWFADTGKVYLKFRTTKKNFLSLVPDQLQKFEVTKLKSISSSDDDTPEWWDLEFDDSLIYYSREYDYSEKRGRKGFAFENEIFAFNPSTKTAYYYFLGID